MKNSKYIISFCLIFIYLLNILGYTLVYVYFKFEVKHDFTTRLSAVQNGRIETIKISKEALKNKSVDFAWIEDYEFSYRGKMYDVVKTLEDEENFTFFCVHDEKEEEIDIAFQKHIDNEFESKSGKKIVLPNKKNLDAGYILFDLIHVLTYHSNYFNSIQPLKYRMFISNILPPPPKTLNFILY